MADTPDQKPGSFAAFKTLARKLAAVPKKELDEKRVEDSKRKRRAS